MSSNRNQRDGPEKKLLRAIIVSALTLALTLFVLGSTFGQNPSTGATPSEQVQFRPPNSGAPQIIQDKDYSTIEAIEDFYRLLESTGGGSSNSFGRSAVWSETADGLSFKGTVGGPVRLQIQNARITIGKNVFDEKKTILLFSTFLRALKAFAGPDCRDVKFTSLSTRAYKNRTVIEFGCSDEVLTLESFSNGPNDEERLYVLDIIKEQDSLMFGTFPGRSP